MKGDYYADGSMVYCKLFDGPTRNEDCAVVAYCATVEDAYELALELNVEFKKDSVVESCDVV